MVLKSHMNNDFSVLHNGAQIATDNSQTTLPPLLRISKDIQLHIYKYLLPRPGIIPSHREGSHVDKLPALHSLPSTLTSMIGSKGVSTGLNFNKGAQANFNLPSLVEQLWTAQDTGDLAAFRQMQKEIFTLRKEVQEG
jgi:hypothetical protein